jgi:hypothetical protein
LDPDLVMMDLSIPRMTAWMPSKKSKSIITR